MTDTAILTEIMEAAREAYYGRHEHGWICTPLIGEVDTAPVLRIARALTADRAASAARVERLEAALKPFAEELQRFEDASANFNHPPMPDYYVPLTRFTYGQLREARSALEGK